MNENLKYINHISYIEAESLLPGIVLLDRGVILPSDAEFTELNLCGLASCTESSSIDNKSKYYTVTVTGVLFGSFDHKDKNIILKLTDLNGDSFIVGSVLPPRAVINTVNTRPSNPTEPVNTELSIQHISTHGILPIISG